ncbi:M14 family metallopeptidase [Candidatus Solirubrobacter pratensis]|uniref:M14 family metallopeptidase n=1 Tax=Candidatus Solirubrobacter pratensis TaxID=1298857 RepID=UPI00041CBEE8|nr:M14 family metallopeptidase [Candidatus Solirubrobacter pratensis]
MVGRKPLVALAASALLLVASQSPAFAADDNGIPFEQLVQVYVPDQDAVDSVVSDYDAAEYKSVQDDGSILLNVFVTAEQKAVLAAQGYKIGRVIEDSDTGPQRMKERQQIIDQEAVAADVAEHGLKGAGKVEGKSVVPGQGDTVIQRAVVFTDAVGPNTGRTTARFLYVEAYNKSTKRVAGSNNAFTGPSLALSYAGPDGVYSTATNMGRFIDTDPTPDEYMYHRQLVRLTGSYANLSAKDIQIRVATAATGGGAAASTETFPVSEWLGHDLPPHVAGFKTEFFTHYQDPTETRADLDALAAKYPELVDVINMPEKTSGYQRKSQAIMYGTGAIGSAPPPTVGAPLIDTTGEITAAQPVARIPFTATAGQEIIAVVDAIPSGETDFILTLKSPTGATLQTVDTGTSPESISRVLTTAGTYTFEISGFQGDLGDFTFKLQPVLVNAATAATRAVVLTTKDWGQLGGNQVAAEFRGQTGANQPLSVAVNGKLVEVSIGTDAAGALSSTAAQVVAAINAKPEAAALLTATTFRGSAGGGIVPVRAQTNLSDFLNAPPSVTRGPFQQHLYRIGAHRDGSKVGVFLFCQQHAREWTTSLSCQETAHELVENYATDPQTKQLLDNVEVFISPNSNPDGAHFSMYDASVQRKTMVNYCPTTGNFDPAARATWGVDMNRNSGEYSLFDGYFGASTSCTNETFAGPFEYSEPETRNEKWVADTFPNIKFMNNIHSYGGYFMWAPGSYKNDGSRTTSPAPNIGVENYFFQAGEKILKRIKDYRGTVILPERTGPIADVLYSAAGNSADDGWYRKGIIAYSFETGADRMLNTTTGIVPTQVGFQPCFGAVGTGGGQGACPADGSLVNEGHDESMEFAAGNYGLVESAYDYAMDTTAPSTSLDADNVTQSKDPIPYRFIWNDEAAVIHYTTDGSTPTLASPTYNNQRARSIGEILKITKPGANTVKWLAVDIKGNQEAVQSKSFLLDQTAPTVTVNIPEGAVYTQGRPVQLMFSCADDQGGSGVASCVGSTASGSNLPTGTAGMQVLTITATDNVGNVFVKTVNYRVLDATNVNGSTAGTVPATLALTLGGPASFGSFTAGIDNDYTASSTATVVSTAGDAMLSIADPSSTNTGQLVNGTFALPSKLTVSAASAGTTAAAGGAVGGSSAPTTLSTWNRPVSNDVVTVTFKQHVGRTDALRTGNYAKTLTFTLSTTTP